MRDAARPGEEPGYLSLKPLIGSPRGDQSGITLST
jgi:hypothetical protein